MDTAFTVGQRVEWLYSPHGGWWNGRHLYEYPVVGRVREVRRRTVHIEVRRRDGQYRRRWVKKERLRLVQG
jgi:hypothetical protein